MDKAFAVISAIGADRVGIVDGLSGAIAEAGGNIEESKMAVLGGEFAIIMLVSLEASALESLAAEVPALEAEFGLRIGVVPTLAARAMEGGRPYCLETVSLDGRGIVHAISAVLRRRGINIEELETSTESAPLTGSPLFRLRAELVIGPGVPIAALRRELEELQAGQDLDLRLTPLVPKGRD